MASAEEEKERAVFDNDVDGDGDGDGDESEEDEEEEDDDDDDDTDTDLSAAAAAAAGSAAAPMEAERPTESTADADDDDEDAAPTTSGASPNPNTRASASSNPNPNGGARGGAAEEARRLFQRLWTEEEELVILRGFSEFTTRRGTAFATHQYDTGPFYEEMRRQLPLDFSKSQLVEKLRRLKKKYLNCVSRLRSAADSFAFRSPHEQALFEIARNIWTPSFDPNPDPDPPNPTTNNSDSDRKPPPPPPPPPPRSRRQQQRRLRRATAAAAAAAAAAAEDPIAVPVPVPVPVTVIAENPTPKQPPLPPPTAPAAVSDLSKLLLKELVGAAVGGPLLGFGCGGGGDSLVNNLGDGRWRKQQILELEVYLKRLELLREHIESTLRELKGSSGGA